MNLRRGVFRGKHSDGGQDQTNNGAVGYSDDNNDNVY